MANCASINDFEGRTIKCSRRNDHHGDHQGKIGSGLTQCWRDDNVEAATAATLAPRCGSRFREAPDEEIYQCELAGGHPFAHRVSFDKELGGGFMPWTDDEALTPNIETTVDGDEAVIVLNGTSGAPIEADEAPAIEADIRSIEKTLAAVNAELIIAEREKKDACDELKRVQNRQNAIVAELVRRINGEQLLPFPAAETVAEDANEEEDDEEETAAL